MTCYFYYSFIPLVRQCAKLCLYTVACTWACGLLRVLRAFVRALLACQCLPILQFSCIKYAVPLHASPRNFNPLLRRACFRHTFLVRATSLAAAHRRGPSFNNNLSHSPALACLLACDNRTPQKKRGSEIRARPGATPSAAPCAGRFAGAGGGASSSPRPSSKIASRCQRQLQRQQRQR